MKSRSTFYSLILVVLLISISFISCGPAKDTALLEEETDDVLKTPTPTLTPTPIHTEKAKKLPTYE